MSRLCAIQDTAARITLVHCMINIVRAKAGIVHLQSTARSSAAAGSSTTHLTGCLCVATSSQKLVRWWLGLLLWALKRLR